MKIKENTKKFVKDHKDGFIIGGLTLGSIAFTVIGITLGHKITLNGIKNLVGVDLSRDFGYNVREMLLKDVYNDTELSEALLRNGFTSLDDTVRAAVLVQKLEK